MPEEVLFKTEQSQARGDVAAYLRQVADTLDAGDAITLRAGEQSVELDPPDRVTFEVKAEREGSPGSPGELSIEFELEWGEGDTGGDGDLVIE